VDQSAASAGAGRIDPEFTAYPLRELAGAALVRAAPSTLTAAPSASGASRSGCPTGTWKPSSTPMMSALPCG
jgi:hypothetical protein